MKDYTLDENDAKYFITGYTKVENKNIIYVFYADGEFKKIKYSKENEKEIQDKMKWQVNYYGDKMNEEINFFIKNMYKKTKRKMIGSIIFCIIGIITNVSLLVYGSLIFSIYSTIFFGIFNNSNKKYLNDYQKNKFYVENENLFENKDTFNQIENIQKNINLSHLSNLVIEKQKENNEPIFTINTIDDMSYNELNDIKNYLTNSKPKIKKRIKKK